MAVPERLRDAATEWKESEVLGELLGQASGRVGSTTRRARVQTLHLSSGGTGITIDLLVLFDFP